MLVVVCCIIITEYSLSLWLRRQPQLSSVLSPGCLSSSLPVSLLHHHQAYNTQPDGEGKNVCGDECGDDCGDECGVTVVMTVVMIVVRIAVTLTITLNMTVEMTLVMTVVITVVIRAFFQETFWHERLRSSLSPFRLLTGNDVSGLLFSFSFLRSQCFSWNGCSNQKTSSLGWYCIQRCSKEI